ncbi:MAG: 30S ribosomal protein S5 [Candidatus Paceibacterota bacterium]|jgi:small subunit ribosomal protein S5
MIQEEKKDDKKFRGKFRGKRRERNEYDQKVIDIARVTRVVKGGKRFSFRTTMVIGNKHGKVGVGIAKGADMKISTEKAYASAKKNIVDINIKGNTIPYPISYKLGGARIILRPASKGTGIMAGGAVRSVMALVGINDITGKMLGSGSKIVNARAAIEALQQFSVKKVGEIRVDEMKKRRDSKAAANAEKNKDIKKAAAPADMKKTDQKTEVKSEKKQ